MKRTRAFILLLVVSALFWEALALAGVFGPHATISEAVWDLERMRPIIPFLAGLVCGHFFWIRKSAAVVLFALLLLPAGAQAKARHNACGVERQAVKTLTDAAARKVDLNPTHITVPVMAAFALRAPVNGNEPRGVEDEEFQTFQLDAIVTFAKHEADRDYHLVLKDDDTDVTMIGESVDPRCAAGSVALAEIAAVREVIDAAGGPKALVGHRVHVAGVAFYDRCHSQTGRAPNCIELHPLTAIEVR